MGFIFIFLIIAHLTSHRVKFKNSLKAKYTLTALFISLSLTTLFVWQPNFIKAILKTSNNLGAAVDKFEINDEGLLYFYSPAENYKLKLNLKLPQEYLTHSPPAIAIWLENNSAYHIKSLYNSSEKNLLPYWSWKVAEYEKAKNEAEKKEIPKNIDTVSSATPNDSFDPNDYILGKDKKSYFLLIEINMPNDSNKFFKDQPSIVYRVEIDNGNPKFYQTFELMGFPKFDEKEKSWSLYYPDETLTSALKLLDSALLIIDRNE